MLWSLCRVGYCIVYYYSCLWNYRAILWSLTEAIIGFMSWVLPWALTCTYLLYPFFGPLVAPIQSLASISILFLSSILAMSSMVLKTSSIILQESCSLTILLLICSPLRPLTKYRFSQPTPGILDNFVVWWIHSNKTLALDRYQNGWFLITPWQMGIHVHSIWHIRHMFK